MIALLVIDMQVGTFDAPNPQHDASGVVDRINRLAEAVRNVSGNVVFIQHDGPVGDTFEPGTRGWQLIPELDRMQTDPVVNKRACDAFYETGLKAVLDASGTQKLLITGSATDYCVDTTVRAAASLDYRVTVVRDAHTTSDRPYLDAATIIQHHNSVWQDLILPRARIAVVATDALLETLPPAHARGL